MMDDDEEDRQIRARHLKKATENMREDPQEDPAWMHANGKGVYKLGKPYKVNGKWYFPKEDFKYDEIGVASWYGPGFHLRPAANGEIFDMNLVSAAHKTLPLPSVVKVTNLDNGRSLLIRVNDRGPFVNDRIIDLSRKAAELLGMLSKGTAKVRVELMPEESMTVASLAQNKMFKQSASAMKIDPAAIEKVEISQEVDDTPDAAEEEEMIQVPVGFKAVDAGSSLENAAAHMSHDGTDLLTNHVQAARKKLLDIRPETDMPASDVEADTPQETASSPAGEAYVQVGAFGSLDNAKRLKASLAVHGNVDITPTKTANGTIYKVRFGPFEDVGDAKRLEDTLLQHDHRDVHIVIE